MNRIRATFIPLITLLAAPVGWAQSTIHEIDAAPAGGTSIASVGDLDGDGVGDYGYDVDQPGAGVVIASGRHGGVIAALPNLGPGAAARVAAAGDVTGDGVPDVAVRFPNGPAAVLVFSGSGVPAGLPVLQIAPPAGASAAPDGFGFVMDGAGDVTGDGVPDLLVGAPADDRAYLVSGADGQILFTFAPVASGLGFGRAVSAMQDDVNDDGVDDVAVSSLFEAAVFSGRTGKRLWRVAGPSPTAEFGRSIASIGDLDFDGVRDLLVGAPSFVQSDWGAVFAFSGRTGDEVKSWGGSPWTRFGHSVGDGGPAPDGLPLGLIGAPAGVQPHQVGLIYVNNLGTGNGVGYGYGTAPGDGFGENVAVLGDANGDGRVDFVTSEPRRMDDATPAPRIRAIAQGTMALTADGVEISLSEGGTQVLTVDALAMVGPIWQPLEEVIGEGRFVLLGGASGIVPGFSFQSHHVPVNVDAYTVALLSGLPFLSPVFGQVDDTSGLATATFTLPPIAEPALVGFTVDHAFLLFEDEALFDLIGASNSVPVRLVP